VKRLSWMLRILGAAWAMAAGGAGVLAQDAPTLRSAVEIRRLSPWRRWSTASGRDWHVTFVETGRTIFSRTRLADVCENPGRTPWPRPGKRIRVTGATYPGLYVPGIEPVKSKSWATASFRRPSRDFAQLAAGEMNYQRVGSARHRARDRPRRRSHAALAAKRHGRLEVHLPAEDAEAAARLVDAAVRVRGLAPASSMTVGSWSHPTSARWDWPRSPWKNRPDPGSSQ